MVTTPTRTETERGKKGRGRPVVLGKVNLLLALLGLLFLAGAYWVGPGPDRGTFPASIESKSRRSLQGSRRSPRCTTLSLKPNHRRTRGG
jgi:hypothetical protein